MVVYLRSVENTDFSATPTVAEENKLREAEKKEEKSECSSTTPAPARNLHSDVMRVILR